MDSSGMASYALLAMQTIAINALDAICVMSVQKDLCFSQINNHVFPSMKIVRCQFLFNQQGFTRTLNMENTYAQIAKMDFTLTMTHLVVKVAKARFQDVSNAQMMKHVFNVETTLW